MKDLTVSLEDRAGALADLGETLGTAGINIEGMCAVTSEGRGIIHLLVEDAAAARMALDGAGIKVEGEAEPMVSELASDQVDQPGAIGAMARAMADAGVNIQVVYLATKNRAVAVTSDNAKARQALGM
ncbi:MAG: amino acid-binding ACT domain-containing protein [Actinomycetota bacterium]